MATKIQDQRIPDAGATGNLGAASPTGFPLTVPGDFQYRQPAQERPWWAFWMPAPDPYQLNPVTPEQLENLRSMAQQLGLTQDQFFQILEAARQGKGDFASLTEYINNVLGPQAQGIKAQRRADELAAETEGIIADQERRLTDSPLTKDARYANQIRDAERAINANIERARLNASRTNADAGARASGKVSDAVSAAEMAGAGEKGRIRSEIQGGINERLEDLPFMRRDLKTGDINTIMGVRDALKGDYFGGTTGLGFDVQSLNFGRADTEYAKAMQALGLITGTAQNATDSALGFATSFGRG